MTYMIQEFDHSGNLVSERNALAAMTLNDAKQAVSDDIERHAADLRRKAVGWASSAEMASWVKKEAEAHAYLVSSNQTEAPLLVAEAMTRQVSIDNLVQRVLSNAAALNALEAMIAGISGLHRDAVSDLDDVNALAVYDWRAGWPVV